MMSLLCNYDTVLLTLNTSFEELKEAIIQDKIVSISDIEKN